MLRAGRPFHSARHDRVRVIQPEDAGLDYASARPERGAFDVSWRCCGVPGRCFFASSNPVKEPVGTKRMFFFISCNRHREQLAVPVALPAFLSDERLSAHRTP